MTADDKKPTRRKTTSYTFWFDAATSRQYAIKSVAGEPDTITVHSKDADLPALQPGDEVYAISDERRLVMVSQPGDTPKDDILSFQTQIIALRVQEDGSLQQTGAPVEALYGFDDQQPAPYVLSFSLLPVSQAALVAAGFSILGLSQFAQRYPTDHPGFQKSNDGMQLFKDFRLPPHHKGSGFADTARLEVTQIMSKELVSAAFNRQQQNLAKTFEVPDSFLEDFFQQYGVDLTEKARRGELERARGNEDTVKMVRMRLQKRTTASVTITGAPGAGKTALGHEVVWQMTHDPQTEDEEVARVIALDFDVFAANNSSPPGLATTLLKRFIKGMIERKGYVQGKKITFFIDELADQMEVRLFLDEIGPKLKPLLTAEGISVIATMADDDWLKFSRNGQMKRRFKSYPAKPPVGEDLRQALLSKIEIEDNHHDMSSSMTPRQIDFIIKKTNTILLDEAQPNKAVEVVGAAYAIAAYRGKSVVEDADIITAISHMTGQSEAFIANDEKQMLRTLEPALKGTIFGQDAAIEELSQKLRFAHSPLHDPEKPRGVFLFMGPTGTGKTELCNRLGAHFGIPVHRFDMSEYMEPHSVARLIGAPPGYVGHNDGGQLVNTVAKTPRCIVLLDEFEKAHEDIHKAFLSAFDAGRMTDGQGREADFRNVIFVMTSNLGARDAEKVRNSREARRGGDVSAEVKAAFNEAAEREFSPEFRGRLNAVIVFNSLTEEVVNKIMLGHVDVLSQRLGGADGIEGVSMHLTAAACSQLREEGYNLDEGARNLKRTVESRVGHPLADWLLVNESTVRDFVAENGPTTLVIDQLGKGFSPRLVPGKVAPGNDNAPAAPEQSAAPTAQPKTPRLGG